MYTYNIAYTYIYVYKKHLKRLVNVADYQHMLTTTVTFPKECRFSQKWMWRARCMDLWGTGAGWGSQRCSWIFVIPSQSLPSVDSYRVFQHTRSELPVLGLRNLESLKKKTRGTRKSTADQEMVVATRDLTPNPGFGQGFLLHPTEHAARASKEHYEERKKWMKTLW